MLLLFLPRPAHKLCGASSRTQRRLVCRRSTYLQVVNPANALLNKIHAVFRLDKSTFTMAWKASLTLEFLDSWVMWLGEESPHQPLAFGLSAFSSNTQLPPTLWGFSFIFVWMHQVNPRSFFQLLSHFLTTNWAHWCVHQRVDALCTQEDRPGKGPQRFWVLI